MPIRPFSAPKHRRSVRPLFLENEEFPVEANVEVYTNREPSTPGGETANALHGRFLKRHGTMPIPGEGVVHGERTLWGKRHVHVDDVRGTIAYARKPLKVGRAPFGFTGRAGEPSAAMPLADVTHVRALPFNGPETGHCFEVSCPPLNLVLRCEEGEEERDRWVEGLSARVQHWKRKQVVDNPSAVPVFGDRSALWRITSRRGW